MAEKLSESTWNAFAKKRDLGDAALVKALAKLDRTDEKDAKPRLEALDEVIDQANRLVGALAKRRKELGDKPFSEAKDRLAGVMESAELLKKSAHEAQAAAGKEAEEEDSPALLTTAMVPLVRQLQQPEVRMPALVCTAGKLTAVLIMRRPIAMTRRKLLADYLDVKGGAKYFAGECFDQGSVLTFTLDGEAGGMAKRIRQAVRDQTGLRVKVRVVGADGVEDLGVEDEPDAPAGSATSQTPTAPAQPAPAPQTAPGSADALAWQQRHRGLEAAVTAALAAGHPEATKLRALLGFASDKADGNGDFAGGLKALDMIDRLLQAPSPARSGEALALWKTRREAVIASLRKVAQRIAAAKHPQSAAALLEINAVMKNLPEAPTTVQQVADLERYLAQDDVVQDVCELAEDIRTPLLSVLPQLRGQAGA